jgi:hypothetical protein
MNSLITHPKYYSKVNKIQMKNITQGKYGTSKQKPDKRQVIVWTDKRKVPGEKFVYNSESELTFTQLLYSEYGATLSYNFHSQSVNEIKITDWQQMCYETPCRNMTFTPLT